MRLLTPALTDYAGSWPPYPGMHPVVFFGVGRLLVVHVWDPDVSVDALEADLRELLRLEAGLRGIPPAQGGMVATHFGTPREIADQMRAHDGPVMVYLEGTSGETQAAFAAEVGTGHLWIKTGEGAPS